MIHPLLIMTIGIVLVIAMIMWLRVNAFIALITAAVVVSLLAVEKTPDGGFNIAGNAMVRVAEEFGVACGKIAIVIAVAAVIGTCMMDSGAADRIVRGFMNLLGEKRAPWALMGSGYLLSVPVFFDTVFYLLVPLARSFYKRTGGAYLKCILAITAGGAITHTLVPPTPGPLGMAANLGIDLGTMILVGALVALPAAIGGLVTAGILDRMFNIPMRDIPGHKDPEPLADDQLPALLPSLAPVVLPVIMIAIHTVSDAMSTHELLEQARQQAAAAQTTLDAEVLAVMEQSKAETVDTSALKVVTDASRIKEIQAARSLSRKDALEVVKKQMKGHADSLGFWTRSTRYTQVIGDPNFALLLSMGIAIYVYIKQRRPSREEMAHVVETSLMSGGLIILITAGGSAFGAMLKVANVGDAIVELFGRSDAGMTMLFLGFGIASLLKVAQGSSTAAMIITSGMLAGMVSDVALPFDKVYLATAIGAGSLVGSWMNDSGFWIFARMGGLTEKEGLCTWTPLLVVLGVVSMAVTLLLATVMPLV